MKPRLLLLLLVVAVATTTSAGAFAQRPVAAPSKYQFFPDQPSEFGYVEPPHYLDHIVPLHEFLMAPLASWDWRTMNGVTPVKNQGAYGTCWAFAALGDLESKILISESAIKDYSELNIQACNPVSTNCNSGGNAWMSTNYLALLGAAEETCDPYPGGCPNPTCVNPACEFFKQVTEWRVIPNDVAAIKSALQTYGPVYTSMYASFAGFGSYDGSYCITYTGTQNPNHAVLIVGFDDDMCNGNGAWIVKNSWGTGWGDNGYFYIQYGHARIGTNSNVITGYRTYNPDMTVHHWDEWGWWSSVGYGDGHDHAVVEIIPQNAGDQLYSVHFWATSGPTTYTLRVYDTFGGEGSGMPTNPLAGPWSGTVSEAGYYTFDLETPLALSPGNPIYIYADLNTGSYVYPVPFDPNGPMETGKSFISNTGSVFNALDNGNYAMGDIGLRATIGPEQDAGDVIKSGYPAWFYTFAPGTIEIIPGGSYSEAIRGANLGMWSTECSQAVDGLDTFCVALYDDLGWQIVANNINVCYENPSGYFGPWINITITAPCEATVGQTNVLTALMRYCDVNGVCQPEAGGCPVEDLLPDYPSVTTKTFEVVAAPPALYILQDTLYFVEQGQTAAYVPFAICNGDPCADDTDYGYLITSLGHVGPAISQGGVITVAGGECGDVYGIIDAGDASVCDYDTLTIIAWAGEEPEVVYDTCVQVIHVIEPVAVPMFSAPVVTILVLAMILAAAVILRRGAARRT